METLFIYFGKVILGSGVMFLYYRLFLKDKTFHHYNRFYLLVAMMISLLLPLIKVSYFTLEVNSNIYLLINQLQHFNAAKILNNDLYYFRIVAFSFGLVSVFFLTRLLFGLIKIERLKKKFKKENFQGISFYQTNLENAPFSFFRNLFWKDSIELQSEVGRQILKHEMVHIEQKHSWDKIFIEIATSLFWFNPIFYFIKKEINLIHEYLADKKAVKNSDTKAFAQMLLASHFSGKMLPATSPFLSSNLKKRLTMLKKSKTKFSYARRILALPILFILAFIYMVNAKNREITDANLEIKDLVSRLQMDTISPNAQDQTINQKDSEKLGVDSFETIQNQIGEKNNEIQPLQESFNKKNEEARKLSDELRIKSEKLRKFSAQKDFDSPKFKALDLEINKLGSKIDNIYNEQDFKNLEQLLNQKYGEIDLLYVKVNAFYNSADFKSQIKNAEKQAAEAEKLVNSTKFKKQIADAEKQARKAEELVNSPIFKKQIADAEKQAKKAEKLVNSPEFKTMIQKTEIAAKKAAENANSKIIILNNSDKNIMVSTDENIKIYLDGKPITKPEMDRLSPSSIEKMEVNKKGYNGSKFGEIHITTKK